MSREPGSVGWTSALLHGDGVHNLWMLEDGLRKGVIVEADLPQILRLIATWIESPPATRQQRTDKLFKLACAGRITTFDEATKILKGEA